uniref:Immunoglobulin heavy constant mu n=2 Tax=Sphenodon punctatus TaxID=8508 RepID=A0A8D0G529_SPHPU
MSHCDNWFDYLGQGTMVTVTSANPAAPVLFPLRPCCDHAGIDESVTIGCLATDFLPDSLTLTWNDQNNASISSAVKTFPSVSSSSGTYSTSTQVSVPGTDWNAQLSFYCLAKHSSGNKEQKVQNNKCLPSEPFFMTLHVPSKENFEGSYRNSTIICQATKVHTRQTTIQWLKDGAPLQSGFATQDPVQDGSKYAITSELTVIDKDWNANHLYSCIVKNDKFVEVMNTSKAFENGCRDDENEIMVEVIPPPFADIFISKSAKLTCRVRNMVTTDGLSVTWVKKNGKELETTVGQRKIQENGLYAVEATATTCADEWERGDIFICKVSHPDVIFPIEKPLQKENKGARHAPSIYVLPPPSEQLALREGATVTCLVKGFFPQDFFVNWLQNGEPIGASKYITREPVLESKQPELFFTYSTLNINEQEWSAGNDYTCVVGHEALPLQVAQKTVDKTTGKPTSVNVSLVLSDTANTCY